MFRKYHYLNHELNKGAHCYIATIGGKPVAFDSVIHFPHPKAKNIKHEHRLVVLPDYQGIGIGNKLSSIVAERYIDKGFRYICVTSTPALIYPRKKHPNWKLIRVGRVGVGKKTAIKRLVKSANRATYSWEYKK